MNFCATPITKENIDAVINAIVPYEYICVNLSECLRKQKLFFIEGKSLLAFRKAVVFFYNTEIIGVLVLSITHVLLHSFLRGIPDQIYEYIKTYFFEDVEPVAIMGKKNISQILEGILTKSYYKKIIRKEDYKLLILDEAPRFDFIKTANDNFEGKLDFVKNTKSDINNLLPLEIAYQEEEVLPDNQKASIKLCKRILLKRVQDNFLYSIRYENNFIAKATANAIGFFWVQIGGVFTLRNFRNKGLGSAIVFFLVKECFKKNKKCALFVKVNNLSARAMYKKLGFKEFCDFRISYF